MSTWIKVLAFVAAYFGWTAIALAASGGTPLPWESPLTAVRDSLAGPVAMGISVIALVVAGGTLVFGGELGEFARKTLMLVLAIALIAGGTGLVTRLFGITGALV
jgi:type IV secretion system protein TrbC